MTVTELQELIRSAPNKAALARGAGCNLRTLYRITDGEMSPGLDLAMRIASAAKTQKPRRKQKTVEA